MLCYTQDDANAEGELSYFLYPSTLAKKPTRKAFTERTHSHLKKSRSRSGKPLINFSKLVQRKSVRFGVKRTNYRGFNRNLGLLAVPPRNEPDESMVVCPTYSLPLKSAHSH